MSDKTTTLETSVDQNEEGYGEFLKLMDSTELTRLREEKLIELRTRFTELFGVARLLPLAALGIGGTAFFFLLLWGLLFVPSGGTLVATFFFFYMLFQGLVLGVFMASMLIGARFLQQLTAVVTITLQTVKEAFSELGRLEQDKHYRAELIGGLIHGALLPSAQSIITVKMGLIRWPIAFVVNRVLKISVRRLTRGLRKKEKKLLKREAAASKERSLPTAKPSKGALRKKLSIGESHLDRLQDQVEILARRTRLATFIPAGILFFFFSFLSSIPWLFVLLVF